MRFWAVLFFVIAAGLGVFSVRNWSVLTSDTVIDLIAVQVTMPLGLVMLGSIATLSILYLIFLVWLETKTIVQFGRVQPGQAKATDAAFAELRSTLERMSTQTNESLRNVVTRLDRVESVVKSEVARASHDLTAEMSRLEPNIKRVG